MSKLMSLLILLIITFQGYAQKEDKYFNRMDPLIRGYGGDSKMEEEFFTRGNFKMIDHAYEQAIDEYTKALEINPYYAKAYNNRGIARRNIRDYSGAIDDFNHAVEINPKYEEAYNNRGNAKLDSGDFQGAIDDYTLAVKLDRWFADAYNNLGLAREKLQDISGALDAFNRAIKLNRKFSDAYLNRGLLRIKAGIKDDGCRDLKKAAELGDVRAAETIKELCK